MCPMKPLQTSRRAFLKTCRTAALASGLPLWFLEQDLSRAAAATPSRSPNGRPGIGLIGCGGMGRGDAQNASRFGEILALCDVDDNHAAEAVKQFTKAGKT